MSKVPVLVTGGAGYIGSHAVLALKDGGWPVAIIDDLGIGAIMHFAGSIVVPESVTNPLAYYGNNTVATHALISAAVAGGVRHILFSSTAAVYGAPETIPVDEDAAKAPINPYGASKLMTEWMLADCSAAYGFNYGALRYFNVSGADRDLRSGQIGKGSTHLIKIAVEAATGKRDHIDVFGSDYPTPDGTCIRDYIHVSDLADAHVLALQRLIDAPDENLLLNCGYGRGLSVLEVLDALDRQLNEPIRREMKPRRAGDPPALVAGNARLLKALAWTPRFNDIETIVRHALEWERKLEAIQAAT